MHNIENDSIGMIDSYRGCGGPHNAHQIAKINKVKDLALFIDQCLCL